MYDMSGFSYDITDVVHLLQLRVRHKNSSSMDVNCPFCGETKGKMNVNLQKMCSGVIGVMLPAECWNYTEDCMVFPVQRQTDRSGKLWERGNTGRIIRWFIKKSL